MKDIDKFRGCLIGGAAGDALGYAVEFLDEETIFSRYGENGITGYDLVNGVAEISDDTQMTLFTANGLLLGTTRGMTRGIMGSYPSYIAFCYKDWLRTQCEKYPLNEEYPYSWLTLIEKIHTMTSPGQASKLKRNNYVVNRIKPDNEQIYYIIDAINDAINAGKQISFQYYDYTGLKKKVLKNKGEVYKLSPYKLLWCGDYYYVLGYSEKKSKVINFRVDRIASKPEILDKDIIPMPDDFDIENYTKEVFFMFSGEKVLVDLRCDNSLMKTMVDRFGEDVTTLAYDMTSFRVQTEVSASPTFFGWVFGFNGKVQILAPESVKEQYKQMIAQADEGMQEKGNKEQEM